MEEDVVRGRCTTVIQQLLYSGGKRRIANKHQRLLHTVAEELLQRAMLLYRLCRAKQEKLASDQTEDAAYCVLAVISSYQPVLWAILTKWSRALRPRSPELRFGAPIPMTLRVREVEQFIARSSYLKPAMNAQETPPLAAAAAANGGNTRKHPRDEGKTSSEAKLEPELVAQLAFAYFEINVTNVKKLHAVVAMYNKDSDNAKLMGNNEETSVSRMSTVSGVRNSMRGIFPLAGDGSNNGGISNGINNNGRAGGPPEEEKEEDDDCAGDYSLLFPSASLSSSSLLASGRPLPITSLPCFATSMNLNTVAKNIETVCSELFFNRLQHCLRNPLLNSPLACTEETNKEVLKAANKHMKPTEQLEAAYLLLCQNTVGGHDRLRSSPTHFLHPLRARPDSLMPLPLQMVTSQQLWTRLLVAGLWLHVVDTSEADTEATTQYCITIVKAARNEPRCAVCDTLVREKPVLRLSALTHEKGRMNNNNDNNSNDDDDGNMSILSWKELNKKFSSCPIPHEANSFLCDAVLKGLSRRLAQKAREESNCEVSSTQCHTSTSAKAAATARRRNHTSSSPSRIPAARTLLDLIKEIEDDYPLPACRAVLMGVSKEEGEDETLLFNFLKNGRGENNQKKCGDPLSTSAAPPREIRELLDGVPCIPRLREADGVLECAACLQQFHQGCICPLQREPTGGIFLCHTCRLARGVQLLPLLQCGGATNRVLSSAA